MHNHCWRLASIPSMSTLSLSELKYFRGGLQPFAVKRLPDVSGGEIIFPTATSTMLYSQRTFHKCLNFDGFLSRQSCCVAAACLSRTRDLETHLAPLATTLVEINLPNEASVDCVAFFLQVHALLSAFCDCVGACKAKATYATYSK